VTYDPAQFSRVDPDRVTYFNAADYALYFTYAQRYSDDFTYGANVKLIRRDLATPPRPASASMSACGTLPWKISSSAQMCRISRPHFLHGAQAGTSLSHRR